MVTRVRTARGATDQACPRTHTHTHKRKQLPKLQVLLNQHTEHMRQKQTRAHTHTSSDPENSPRTHEAETGKSQSVSRKTNCSHFSTKQSRNMKNTRPRAHNNSNSAGTQRTCRRKNTTSAQEIVFCPPTFLVHPLQAESEVPPPARHGDEGDEEVEERSGG